MMNPTNSPPLPEPDAPTPIPPLTGRRVEEYAVMGGTDEEIAARFLVEPELIRARFADVLRSGRALHALLLRAAQFNDATRELSTAMLTFLGRNVLGQTNNPNRADEKLEDEQELAVKNG